MTANREIKIYGTLLNATVNAAIGDADHNDALGYAYQLYDNRFGDEEAVNNFQDIINKRLTAISYSDGVTTIKNRPGTPDGIPYMFVVEGDSNINGNLKTKNISAGDIAVKAITASDGMTITGDVIVTSGDLSLNNGDLDVDGTASISGATSIGGTLDVIGATKISSPVNINSNLTVAGTSSFGGQMTANGINSAADVNAPNISQLRTDINIINGDKTVDGSIKKAIDDLYQLLMGGSSGQHIDYDTINELANFVVEHKDFAEALQTLANQNKEDIVNLKAKDTVLEGRINTNVNDITDLKDSVLHLGADVENHEVRITNLEGTSRTHTSEIGEIKEWMHEAQVDKIEILRNEVERVGNKVNRVENKLDNDVDRLDDKIDTEVSGLQNQINTGITNLRNQVTGEINRVDGRINNLSLNSLTDVNISSASSGQVLKYDGTKWVAGTDEAGSGDGDTTIIYNIFGKNVTYNTHSIKFKKKAYCQCFEDDTLLIDTYPDTSASMIRDEDGLTSKHKRLLDNVFYLYTQDGPGVPNDEQIISTDVNASQFRTIPYVKKYSQNYGPVRYINESSIETRGRKIEVYDNNSMIANYDGAQLTDDAQFLQPILIKTNQSGVTDYFDTSSNSVYYNLQYPNLIQLYKNEGSAEYSGTGLIYPNTVKGCVLSFDVWQESQYNFGPYFEADQNNNYIIKYDYYKYPIGYFRSTYHYVENHIPFAKSYISSIQFKNESSVNKISGYTVHADVITSQEYLDKVKWSNGSSYIEVPHNDYFFTLCVAKDCELPDEIYVNINTWKIDDSE